MQTHQYLCRAKTSRNHIQNYILFGLFMALFLCINLANGISQKTTCYLKDKKDYYSATWEAYKIPSEGGAKQAFDITFTKISNGTSTNLLSSTISPFNPSLTLFKSTYHIRNPDAEYVQTSTGFGYRMRDGSSVTLPIYGLLSYAESVNAGAKNNVWWRISSNDDHNKEWTIEFSYNNLENKIITVKSNNAGCKVSYSPGTDDRITSADVTACGSKKYTDLYHEIYGVEVDEPTCNLL